MDTAINISEIIYQQDAIIQKAIQVESKAGYFAVLYNKMIIRVQQAIFDGEFQNNDRMERLIGILQVYTRRPVMDLQISKR